MARIHVRNADKNGNYSVIVHEPIAAGNNAEGLTWKSVYLEHKKTFLIKEDGSRIVIPVDSVMTEGTEAGQITAVERAQVQSGELTEIQLSIRVGKEVNALVLQELANKKIDGFKSQMANELKWYGHSI